MGSMTDNCSQSLIESVTKHACQICHMHDNPLQSTSFWVVITPGNAASMRRCMQLACADESHDHAMAATASIIWLPAAQRLLPHLPAPATARSSRPASCSAAQAFRWLQPEAPHADTSTHHMSACLAMTVSSSMTQTGPNTHLNAW